MNFKKNQRRIPMNFKKIIPLTFAALSVAGALSACSDNKVVGADEQQNTMGELSSSSITPGSSGSQNAWRVLQNEAMAAVRSVSRETAVTYSYIGGEDFVSKIDSVTAHETFDRIAQSILDIDPTVRYSEGISISNSWLDYTYLTMKDEEGLLHEIIFNQGKGSKKDISCIDNDEYVYSNMYEVYFNPKSVPNSLPNKAFKYMMSADSTLMEEFKKDCALENGTLEVFRKDCFVKSETLEGLEEEFRKKCALENGEVHGFDGDVQIRCIVNSEEVNGVETYKDPYWKKYAKYIIDSCVSTKSIDELGHN